MPENCMKSRCTVCDQKCTPEKKCTVGVHQYCVKLHTKEEENIQKKENYVKTLALRIREDDVKRLESIYPNRFEKFSDYFHEIMHAHFSDGSREEQSEAEQEIISETGSETISETDEKIMEILSDIRSIVTENNDRLFGRNGIEMYGNPKKVKPPVEFVFDEDDFMILPKYIEREELQYLKQHPKDLDQTCSYLRKFLSLSEDDTERFRKICRNNSLEEDGDEWLNGSTGQ